MKQIDAFEQLTPIVKVGRRHGETIQEAFEAFHAANPHVYMLLTRLARQAVISGRKKVGIGMLFEVLRWNYLVMTTGEDFKLNNNFRSRYVRMIEGKEPDLSKVFETRELKAK